MNELESFVKNISDVYSIDGGDFSIETQRVIVREINDFLFCTYDDIGELERDGINEKYFSDFHKYWAENYLDILGLEVNEDKCKKVAEVLHNVFVRSKGKLFTSLDDKYTKYRLKSSEICLLRFLTANQDFRGSLDFEKLVGKYKKNKKFFNIEAINKDPGKFLLKMGIKNLSQDDKRATYVKNLTDYLIKLECTPYEVIWKYDCDVTVFKKDMMSGRGQGSGYGNKKLNMFIRDMYLSGIWTELKNFDKINIASDFNTIRIGLRTGILSSKIPLVSSFIDIFSYQYSLIDRMNEMAWRRVWEIWKEKYPEECVVSPCLMDNFIYDVIGRQICKETLAHCSCSDCGDKFYSTSSKKQCISCKSENLVKNKMLPCTNENGSIAIHNTKFYKSKICEPNYDECPFTSICCDSTKMLDPPRSISIIGKTGWSQSYSVKGHGGGGPMA